MSAQQRESGSWWMLTSQLTKELSGLQWLHTAYSSRYATAVCLVRQLPRCSACFCSPLWVHEEASVFLCQASLMAQTSRLSIKEQVMHLLHLRWQVSCYRWIGLQPPKSLLCAGTP